ncbi:MAG: sigma-70 family RNA polymerase sigma factor [Ilumatobacteraceae bacterium]
MTGPTEPVRYEAAIRRLDHADFDALVRHEAPGALRLATVVLGTAEGADDVVQVAMERAWSSIGRYDAARPFRPWFFRIVANTARNDRRQRGRMAALALRAGGRREPAADSTEEHVITAAERRLVLAAINRLDVEDRLVIALRYFEQLGESEMADVLACPPGTVKSRLTRARIHLRRHLEDAGG